MILERINAIIWSFPALFFILGVGFYLSIKSSIFQLRFLPCALRTFVSKLGRGERRANGVSPFQALCTALAATVGTGNIAGVAGAVILGGPGAVFWMWVSGFLGMIIKCAEAALCVRYRRKSADGTYYGGPMYMIVDGLPKGLHFLAWLYATFGVIAALGVGNATQMNTCISGLRQAAACIGMELHSGLIFIIAAAITLLISAVLLGGAKRIGAISQWIVPFAAAGYILLCLGALLCRWRSIPAAFLSIFRCAFSPRAYTGGAIGSMLIAVRIGVSRGVFTNEAGMGTAGIAHAGASVKQPVEQGLMGIVEVFLDTIVICTLTALVILSSGVEISYGFDVGAMLTGRAFSSVYGQWIAIPMALFLFSFAFATMIGWGFYGLRCAQFLFGSKSFRGFVALQAIVSMISVSLRTGTVWLLSDIVNGLMAIPNLIALVLLTQNFLVLIREYKLIIGRTSASGGTHEDFNQCKPLRAVSYAQIPPSGGGSRK